MADTSEAQDQQVPLAAQIPLESFTLPTFPPAASHLRSLTLTSDINLNDYQSKHLHPGTFEPSTTLPKSITHLTLELFSLGFPAPFLKELAKSLPNLQSLTLFSCLIDGLDDASRKDTLAFFKSTASTLKELHVVDTFARVGFWKEVGDIFSSSNATSGDSDAGLKVLEVSYTYRGHHESDFLNRTAGEEWSALITPSLMGVSLNFAAPPEDESDVGMQAEKPEDQEELKAQDGILPFASDGRASLAIRRKFEALSTRKQGAGTMLKVLNLSMFALRPAEVGEVLYACAAAGNGDEGVVGLTVSILLEEKWLETLSKELAHHDAGKALESLELTGVPGDSSTEVAAEDVEKLLMKSEEGMKSLAKACPKMERFEMTILKSRRIGSVVWEKEGEGWKMHRDTRGEA
ncbi:hypothetical protein PMZ80_008781 [Knufia obscura]|uniref:Uncharacterized protein n=2 Tax=Knufia TaxID=430999 RepID=A0AAN8EJB2_9EURO|nr:hypothetical protein PMZ80_008781 [Knufia obscura]KAK5955255.1 hypothetical protein OHC33_003937 [Knufia fluminis]